MRQARPTAYIFEELLYRALVALGLSFDLFRDLALKQNRRLVNKANG